MSKNNKKIRKKPCKDYHQKIVLIDSRCPMKLITTRQKIKILILKEKP
jgi:hypothetical protein